MQIYLVGGAVRDQLLGRPVTERDYVVVGATPEEMLALGFKPVGKEFPVFLHPETHEEYALARTERKVAKGYKGFSFYTSPEVTLEQDLRRRDLTMNAMAQDNQGHLIDPYHGQKDLQQKILRHVSPAFAEDPVRILRLARFAARFPEFQPHPETMQLMRQMVAAGEVDALVPERVWQELHKALRERQPSRFFEVLQQCDALRILFKPFSDNKFEEILSALQAISAVTPDATMRFAALFESTPIASAKNLCQQLRAPQEYTDLALLVSRHYQDYKNSLNLDAADLLKLLEHLDAFRRKDRFVKFLHVCQALSGEFMQTKQQRLQQAYQAALAVEVSPFVAAGLEGTAIANALKEARIAKIIDLLG